MVQYCWLAGIPFPQEKATFCEKLLELFSQVNGILYGVCTNEAIINVERIFNKLGSLRVVISKVESILLKRHVCGKGGCGDSKGNSGHTVVLEWLLRGPSPYKSVKVTVRGNKLNCTVHFAYISSESDTMEPEPQENINERGVNSRSD